MGRQLDSKTKNFKQNLQLTTHTAATTTRTTTIRGATTMSTK